MNDFETVRETLSRPARLAFMRKDALAALDRIEAEVEKLRAGILPAGTYVGSTEHVNGLEAEVERLQRLLDERVRVSDAEVERLTAIKRAFENLRAALAKEEA